MGLHGDLAAGSGLVGSLVVLRRLPRGGLIGSMSFALGTTIICIIWFWIGPAGDLLVAGRGSAGRSIMLQRSSPGVLIGSTSSRLGQTVRCTIRHGMVPGGNPP